LARLPATSKPPPALERATELLSAPAKHRARKTAAGYLDLLGDTEPTSTGTAQDLMLGGLVPRVYERWWRPLLGRVAKGVLGPGMQDEHRIALELLSISEGDRVLDVACGPGNFTRTFASAAGRDGLAVGVDASTTMLARGAGGAHANEIALLRADATALPFRAASFDAVCCFAALNLMDDPMAAIDEMTRVLKRGGRIALFTSAGRRLPGESVLRALVKATSGMTIFGSDELTGALAARGFTDITQRLAGVTQFVGASKL
jgi:SAM-dependent methyltransferase